MGLLKDAVNLGYITLDEYNDMADDWSDLGYEARHYGDTEALQSMVQDFLDLGFEDLATLAFEQFDSSISFYEAEYGYSIYYEINSKRWRDVESGRFVKDPYEWIRD